MPFGVPVTLCACSASYQAPQVRILSNSIKSYNRCAVMPFGVPTTLSLPRTPVRSFSSAPSKRTQ